MAQPQRLEFIEAAGQLAMEGKITTLHHLSQYTRALNQHERERLFTMVEKIHDEYERAKTLTLMSMADLKQDELERLATLGLALKDKEPRDLVLRGLFCQLKAFGKPCSTNEERMIDKIIGAVIEIDPSFRYEIFIALRGGRSLNRNQSLRLVAAAREIEDETRRLRAFGSLGAELIALELDDREVLINQALRIEVEDEWTEAIMDLVTRVDCLKPDKLYKKLLDTVNKTNDGLVWIEAIIDLLASVDHLTRKEFRKHLLGVVHTIEDENYLRFVLEQVVSQAVYLSKTSQREFMRVTMEMEEKYNLVGVLKIWIEMMAEANLAEALRREIVLESLLMTDEGLKSMLLESLGPRLEDVPENLKKEVVDATLSIKDKDRQVKALRALACSAHSLLEEEGKRFFNAVTAMDDRAAQASVLAVALDAVSKRPLRPVSPRR